MTIPKSFYFNRLLIEEINMYYNEISHLEESEQLCIFLYFLFELKKKEKSKDIEYLNCLPKDETCFPIFYSPENKDYLKGSLLIEYSNKNLKKIKNEFELLKNEFPEKFENVDLKEYLKIRLTFGARIFDTDKSNSIISAVPIADLINFHPEKVNCCWRIDEDNNFSVKAIRDIENDEEVFFKILNFYYKKN